MRPDVIRDRAAAIRFFNKTLSERTGLNENTIHRTLSGKTSPNLTTCDLLENALVAEEIRLRDYLLGLHPLPPTKVPEAA